MATPKCVSAKCIVKDIFDEDLKPAVLKQMKKTIQTAVDKNPKLEFKDSCKEGFLLTVTASVLVDDEDNPTSIEAKVSVVGIAVGGTATGFNATGSSKTSGVNPKKMEEEATFIVDDALGKLMTGKVVPQMAKP
jgi:hypothetical protein